MSKKCCCNPFSDWKLAPCASFLGSDDPLIKDNKAIYRNLNRFFYFITTTQNTSSTLNSPSIATNLQINLTTFLIGLYINQIQVKEIKYTERQILHHNKKLNNFIYDTLENPPKLIFNSTPGLCFVISNGNGILPLYTYSINITPVNYLILLVINRLEHNPGLFFGNNSYVLNDCINLNLASLYLGYIFKCH